MAQPFLFDALPGDVQWRFSRLAARLGIDLYEKTPSPKTFDWWGGGAAGAALTERLKGKALSEDVVAPSSRHGENTAFFQFFRWRASWLRQSVIPLER